jgi:PleD family two-component response regulator
MTISADLSRSDSSHEFIIKDKAVDDNLEQQLHSSMEEDSEEVVQPEKNEA